jgi:hypothetical protein
MAEIPDWLCPEEGLTVPVGLTPPSVLNAALGLHGAPQVRITREEEK